MGFEKEGRHFYRSDIEIAGEIPDHHLAGSYEKVLKVQIDENHYIYLISLEDIIIFDRLKARVHSGGEEDCVWGFRLLSGNYNSVDIDYLRKNIGTKEELKLSNEWIEQIQRDDT